MRENTKWIMLVTALAFVALMVFEWGMDMTGRSSGVTGLEMGSVNGEEITAEEYNVVYRNLYQQQIAAMQGSPVPSSLNRQIEDAAWDQLVTQKLLQQELDRRGITVTAEEIREAARLAPPPELQSAPVFQTDGQFDIAKYQQFLASAQDDQFLQQLEGYYRDVIPRSKLYFQASAGVTVTDGQLWRMYRDANETVTVQYLAFDPEALVSNDQVSVTDEQVSRYHGEHRDDFLRPAQVTVRYVALDRTPSAEDSAAALQRAQELRAAAAGGEDFEAVAQRAADDLGGAGAGQSFSVTRGQSAPAIDQAVFSTPAGQVTQPILTQNGYHVVRVESRQADTAQVRQFVVPVELSRQNEDRLLDRADSLEMIAQEGTLEQAAERLGMQLQGADVSPALPILPGVGTVDEGLDWAMGANPGEVSDVMETESSFYIMELVSRREEGPLSLEEAAPTIRAYLLRQAKIERARQLLAPIAQRAGAGAPLEQLAGEANAQVQQAGPFTRGEGAPGLGRLNAAVGAAFGLRPGTTSPLIEADDQLFLIRTVSRTEPSRQAWQEQLAEQRVRVVEALADNRWNQYLLALRESAEIVDNRRELERQQAQAAAIQ